MRAFHAWLAISSFTVLGVAESPAYETRMQAGVTYSDNLSRTSYRPYRQEAATEAASLSVLDGRQLTSDWLLVGTGTVGTDVVSKFSALDEWHADLGYLLRHKFGLGPYATVLDLTAGVRSESYHESGRSGWQTTAEATLAKRLLENWRVTANTGLEDYAAKGHSFDVRGHHLQLETDWDITDLWRLSLGAKRYWGQLTANAEWETYEQALSGNFGPRVASYYWNSPWEVTTTFGHGWTAYRVDCYADFHWVEVSYSLGANTTMPLRYETVKVVNRAGVRYDTTLWSLNLVHRF